MAYIKIDHSKFSNASNAIDSYVDLLRTKMNSAGYEVDQMYSDWQSSDYTQFKEQWNETMCSGSTYSDMVRALESYSKFLKYAAEKYKDAQIKAVNRANGLPKW